MPAVPMQSWEQGAVLVGLTHSNGHGEPSQGIPRLTVPGGRGGTPQPICAVLAAGPMAPAPPRCRLVLHW